MENFKSILVILVFISYSSFSPIEIPLSQKDTSTIISYEVHLATQQLGFYWKDEQGNNYGSLQNLKTAVEKKGEELVFAMNGGMYQKDRSPQGLYIENGITKSPINTQKGDHTNFFLHPNGVFYITKDNKATICTTPDFKTNSSITYATQSGPMLLIDGKIHAKFNEGSPNLHIRNAVGILPNGDLLFAMSKKRINFYDLACFFKDKGCKNALYLDGFVSRMYAPSRYWEQLDGNFGVIIAETRKKR